LRDRDINAPLPSGAFPYGTADPSLRVLKRIEPAAPLEKTKPTLNQSVRPQEYRSGYEMGDS
jgi:hypothetical protein